MTPSPKSSSPVPKDASSADAKPVQRTPEEIEQDLASLRKRFTATLDELSVRTAPDELGKEVSDVAGAAASDGISKAKAWAGLGEDSEGIRPELIGAAAGAAVAVLILVIRSRRSTVAYEFALPSDAAQVEGLVVRARGRKIPSHVGAEAV